LANRLESSPESEWDGIALRMVTGHVASVLGYASGEAIDPELSFRELGLDSLSALALKNRLSQATGIKLSSALVFNYPTIAALAAYLRRRAAPVAATPAGSLDDEVRQLENALSSPKLEAKERARIVSRIRGLVMVWEADERPSGMEAAVERIESATNRELFDLVEGFDLAEGEWATEAAGDDGDRTQTE
jgi:acyl carrier protein